MKKTRKILALLLVVVMVFAMSVSAFAAPSTTVSLNVTAWGESLHTDTVEIKTGMTAKDVLDTADSLLELKWKSVPNLNPNPAFGKTAFAIDTIYNTGSNPIGAQSGIKAQFWSTQYPGYGIEYTEIVNGETVYHFIYVGEDWQFTVNGEKPIDPDFTDSNGEPYQLYMDQYEVQPGDQIAVDYVQEVTRWTDTSNWITA